MQPDQLLQQLNASSVRWTMGSRAYGLDTPTSDIDLVQVYDSTRLRILPFPEYPDVLEFAYDSNTEMKLYSLHKFIDMLAKGNPNAIEMVWYKPDFANSNTVLGCLLQLNEYVLNQTSFAQYFGHVLGVLNKYQKSPLSVSNKNVAHAMRLLITVRHLLAGERIYRIKEHHEDKSFVLARRLAADSDLPSGIELLKSMDTDIRDLYSQSKHNFPPDSSELKLAANKYFKDLYK